jgi:Ca-activated chloride channel homolog
LNGEDQELVDSVVNLSVRYGIITPYTSFLIDENDILSQSGRRDAEEQLSAQSQLMRNEVSGAAAVDAADQMGGFANAEAPAAPPVAAQPTMTAQGTPTNGPQGQTTENGVISGGDAGGGEAFYDDSIAPADEIGQSPIQAVGDKTFILQNGVWTDTTFQPDTMETQKIVFLSDEYFALLDSNPDLAQYFAVGDRVIVVVDDTAYEVTAE